MQREERPESDNNPNDDRGEGREDRKHLPEGEFTSTT